MTSRLAESQECMRAVQPELSTVFGSKPEEGERECERERGRERGRERESEREREREVNTHVKYR